MRAWLQPPSPPATPPGPRAADGLAAEHGALLRQIGALQRRCSEQWRAAAAAQATLEGANLRLRAELMLLRTGMYWGLGAATVLRRPAHPRQPAPAHYAAEAPEAQAVICQTGCVGHAHPWLAADGQCQRSGQPCERQARQAPA
jgi:hypothetical protein